MRKEPSPLLFTNSPALRFFVSFLEQIANGFTKTDSGSCFDKLSTNGWILGVVIKTVHPEPVEG